MNNKYEQVKIDEQWSRKMAIEYGKDIVLQFSKEYSWIAVRITGDDKTELEISMLGGAVQKISASYIKHIHNPALSFKAGADDQIQVSVETRETNV